jgi:hypothetical protein
MKVVDHVGVGMGFFFQRFFQLPDRLGHSRQELHAAMCIVSTYQRRKLLVGIEGR